MTNELEKQFFDTFGIEEKHGVELTIDPTTDDNVMNEHYVCYGYPQISDRILLKLMFLITDINTSFELRNIRNVTALKTAILEFFIKKYGSSQNRKILKHQVRTLFEEEK